MTMAFVDLFADDLRFLKAGIVNVQGSGSGSTRETL